MTTYHFEEEYDDRSNVRNNYLSSKHESNYDEVDTITIINMMESKVTKKEKTHQYKIVKILQ